MKENQYKMIESQQFQNWNNQSQKITVTQVQFEQKNLIFRKKKKKTGQENEASS
jgi:hypothetical protein